MHFLNFKANQVYHIVFQVFSILKDEDKLKRKLILDEIFILYKPVYWDRVVRFCAYTFCQKKYTLSARPYIESVSFCAYTLFWWFIPRGPWRLYRQTRQEKCSHSSLSRQADRIPASSCKRVHSCCIPKCGNANLYDYPESCYHSLHLPEVYSSRHRTCTCHWWRNSKPLEPLWNRLYHAWSFS